MSGERQVVDLLYWIKGLGLTPRRPCRSDRFLNPYTNRIVKWSPRLGLQLEHLLWLPNAAGVRKHLPVQMEPLEDLTTARLSPNLVGAGPGESEAILSLFHLLRTKVEPQPHAA